MTVAKPGSRHLDPVTFLLTRWILALGLTLLVSLLSGSLAIPSWSAAGFVVVGAVMNAVVGWTIYLLAMERAPGYLVTALASTAPLWGVLGAIVFVGEPFRWTALIAALLVVGGAFFLLVGRAASVKATLPGALLALVAGVLWGISESVPMNIATRLGMVPETSIVVFACAAIVGVLLLTPLLRRKIPRRVDRPGIGLAALSAVSGAFLGWFLWLSGLQLAPASLLAPVRGSTLLFTFFFSIVFLRERPTRWSIVGVLLMFGGVLLVSLGS